MPPGVNDRLLKAKFELKASSTYRHFPSVSKPLISYQMQEKDLQRQISKKKELEKKEKKALLQVRFVALFILNFSWLTILNSL
jgi:hypothetical protein